MLVLVLFQSVVMMLQITPLELSLSLLWNLVIVEFLYH